MRSLSDTLARMAAFKAQSGHHQQAVENSALTDCSFDGPNPGALRAKVFIPKSLNAGAELVVVLHGCTQTAAAYDYGSGWSQLAERNGFALLYPEQQRANNSNRCFNWFEPNDARRGYGEALSIRQMIEAVVSRYAIDPDRIFVTGLSAGGAMASVMLATYPEVFAGGAIIAGLPYGTAASVPEAFDRMRGQGRFPETKLRSAVEGASPHRGPWPTISVWHGSNDRTVVPSNATDIVSQWRGLHGLSSAPSTTELTGGHTRRVWRDPAGKVVIEEHLIAGMGHGTPLSAQGSDTLGVAGPFMLNIGISSTHEIAQSWGLTTNRDTASVETALSSDPIIREPPLSEKPTRRSSRPSNSPTYVQSVIEDALRAAGLMR